MLKTGKNLEIKILISKGNKWNSLKELFIMNKKLDQIKSNMREIKVTRNPDGSKTTEVNPDDIREIGSVIVNIIRLFIKK